MAYVFRLIFVVLLGSLALPSFAAIELEYTYTGSCSSFNGNNTVTANSPSGVCAALSAKPDIPGYSAVWASSSVPQGRCNVLNASGAVVNACGIQKSSVGSCPANSSSNGAGGCACSTNYVEKDGQCVKKPLECPEGMVDQGGICVPKNCTGEEVRDPATGLCVKPPDCPEGQIRVNGQCVKSKCPKAGTPAGDGWGMSSESDEYKCESQGWGTSGTTGGADNTLKCMIRVRNNFDFTGPNGEKLYFGSGKYTGAECSGGSSSGGSGGNTGGGNNGGTNPGGGDGGNGGNGGNGGGGTGPEPTKPDPSKPVPKPPSTPPGTDGKCPEGYTKKNGVCYAPTPPPKDPDSDGKCPSGTIKMGSKCVSPGPSGPDDGNGGDGNSTGTGTGGGGGGDKGNGEFGGSCKAGFACKGDAIQCAMAREQFMRNCQAFDNSTPESQLYEKSKGKEGDVTKDLPGNTTADVGSALSRDSLIGGGSCMPDLALTVMSQPVHVPFSQYCDYFRYMGYILVAFSLLVAVRIVGSGG